MQMKAFDTLMMQPPPPPLPDEVPVLARLDALDDTAYAEQKVAIRRSLHIGYLNNVEPWFLDYPPDFQREPPLWCWTPEQQSDVLFRAMQSIETYERDIQCKQLALVVRTLFQERGDPKKAVHATCTVPKLVHDFLGPPVQYDETYVQTWWSMPLPQNVKRSNPSNARGVVIFTTGTICRCCESPF
jgi:hypothetical protein